MACSGEPVLAIDAAEKTNHDRAVAWHALPESSILLLLATSLGGLSSVEAVRRLAVTGRNQLCEPKPIPPLRIFFRQFNKLLVWVLLVAGLSSILLGDWLVSVVIFAIVLLKALVGFCQGLKGARSIAALKPMTTPNARVWRDRRLALVPIVEVVPGDILEFEPGDWVAADARLMEAHGLQCGEAQLTGESKPVSKQVGILREAVALADRENMVFMGASITAGTGRALVVATGMETELGHVRSLPARPRVPKLD